MYGYYVVVAVAAGALLVVATGRPHPTSDAEEETGTSPVTATMSAGQASSHFPPTEIAKFRTIAQDTLSKVQAGDQVAARARVTDLETAWDDDEATLRPMDETAWGALDAQIDSVLHALRASAPDPLAQTKTLTTLLNTLR